jgi:glycosyltransferase involved in cell wall biosynthesis
VQNSQSTSAPPTVSVVMAAYNAEYTIARAILSIQRQTYTNLELIIVDDGSADGTAARVRAVADDRVRLITNEANLGISRSANRGVEAARGHYIARMDADDVAMSRRLERQVRFLEGHPKVLALGGAMRRMDRHGEIGRVVVVPERDAELRLLTLWGAPIQNPTAMIRRNVFDEFGLRYRTECDGAEDYDLWARLLAHGEVANLPTVECLYRTWDESISNRKAERIATHHLTIADAYAKRLFGEESPLLEDATWLVRLLVERPTLDAACAWRLGRTLVRLVDGFLERTGTGRDARLGLLRCAGEQALYLALKGTTPRRAVATARALFDASPLLFAGGVWAQLCRQGRYEWPRLLPGIS